MSTGTAENSLNHDPLVRETLGGRYKIDRLIGRGGIGLVYLALDEVEGRKVVVKVLAPHWTDDDDAVARFDREALRMAKLDHPNVVRMYDHGHHGDQAFIVMEFLDGEPLRHYLNRKSKLSFEEFVPIASQVLAGVGYVHARNIMLRDIKPPNIMLCERDGKANHVKLLDFGLAKLMGEDDELTKAHVIGTAGYLSPEQIRGEKIDVRVDVYALGIMFFLMLAGESPIQGDNDAAILFNHVHGNHKRLEDCLPPGHRVPQEVIDLIHQALAKTANERPADANEMAEVLFESVHPSMFLLPTATDVTRRPAQEYWSKRLRKGAKIVEDLEASSGEHTRPVIKRTLEEVRNAANLASGPQPLPERPPSTPRSTSGAQPLPRRPGSGVKPLPTRPRKKAPLPPRRPLPKAEADDAPPDKRTQFGMPRGPGRTLPPPPPRPSSTTLGLPVPKGKPGSGAGPLPRKPGSGAGPLPRTPGSGASRLPPPNPSGASDSSTGLPKPKPIEAPDVPPRRVGMGTEAPAANVAAPVGAAGLTMRFDAQDARAAALKEHAPTDRVSVQEATAMAAGISPLVEGPDNDSLPIAIDEDLGGPSGPLETPSPGTGPIAVGVPPVTSSRLSLPVLVLAGLGALALGGATAYFALSGPSSDAKSPTADASGEAGQGGGDEGPKPPPVAAVLEDGGAQEPPDEASDDVTVDDEAASPGKLVVKGPSGATLFVDGAEVGKLPYDDEIAAGKHELRVEAKGYDAWEGSVEVGADAPAAVEPDLVKSAAKSRPSKRPSRPPPTSKSDPSPPPPSSTDAPKTDDKPKKKKDDVFINPDKGNDSAGIFLPVGK